MGSKAFIIFCISFCLFIFSPAKSVGHEITFCGEKIPVTNEFVAQKLMNVIKKQMQYVNMPSLRKAANRYFPHLEKYLRDHNLPQDLKYLPIIESGFAIRTSTAGAQGYWQLMPNTARELGLVVQDGYDQRNDFESSTIAACNLLIGYYKDIHKSYGVSSWVLTAAAYNFGIGNMGKNIKRQGKDYFSMNLNDETAEYVYKIIAVKELFEYPELYMKNFSYNIFQASKPPKIVDQVEDLEDFKAMEINVVESETTASVQNETKKRIKLVSASIKGKYKNFNDGDQVTIELQDNLIVKNRYISKGNIIKGVGWIIDDRVFIDMGFDSHDVILYDSYSKQGIPVSDLRNNEAIILKVQMPD